MVLWASSCAKCVSQFPLEAAIDNPGAAAYVVETISVASGLSAGVAYAANGSGLNRVEHGARRTAVTQLVLSWALVMIAVGPNVLMMRKFETNGARLV
jgi:hypothetical protein